MNLPPNTAMSRGLGRGKKRTEGEGRGMAPQLVRINFRVELNYTSLQFEHSLIGRDFCVPPNILFYFVEH